MSQPSLWVGTDHFVGKDTGFNHFPIWQRRERLFRSYFEVFRVSEGNPLNAIRCRANPEFATNYTKYTNKENADEEILHGVAPLGRDRQTEI